MARDNDGIHEFVEVQPYFAEPIGPNLDETIIAVDDLTVFHFDGSVNWLEIVDADQQADAADDVDYLYSWIDPIIALNTSNKTSEIDLIEASVEPIEQNLGSIMSFMTANSLEI